MKNQKLYGVPDRIWAKMFGVIVGLLFLTLCSCSSYRLATISDDMYPVDFTIPVSSETKIDTINSLFDLKYKLRTDFNFRWDFAQYAMQQPYSWYFNNPRLEGIWRPYNRFDVYFHSHWFWSDWAWGYNYYGWNSFYNWNRPWYYRPYSWGYSWYDGPWHNPGYNIVWNSSRRANVAYINGPRGSRIGSNSIIQRNDSNIENTIVRRYNKPRNDVINNIVDELRDNYNIKPRVYSNPNNVPNNNKPIINNNNIRPNWNNSRPVINNNNNINSNSSIRSNNSFSSPPPSSTISRGSSTSSGGSSRGGNSKGRN
jgi:hypothetical protein|tara:strand:+ start:39 stop:974 length:936 start_codon:yes stop_codon:yes gene_type:complete